MHVAASQPIPIASASRVDRDPHSLTPRCEQWPSLTSGSPRTFRPNSFGHRFFPGCSPLGPLAVPDFNFNKSMSSSIENDHDHLIKSINGDVMSMQEDMCRNYTCCGLALQDLHALVEHFEDAHVVVLDPYGPEMCSGGFGAFDATVDMDMGTPPIDSVPPSPIAQAHPSTCAFDTTSVLSRRSSHMFAPYPTPHAVAARARSAQPDLYAQHHPPEDYSSLHSEPSLAFATSACVRPGLLFSPSATPSPLNTPAASRGTTPDPSSESEVPSPRSPRPPASSTHTFLPKPFRCPKQGCTKSYKQANGLKYHLTHGQCNFTPRDPNVDDLKPYVCQVGCKKRFKNMSGLRYHYAHTGEHGRIGMALLQAGQTPVAE